MGPSLDNGVECDLLNTDQLDSTKIQKLTFPPKKIR